MEVRNGCEGFAKIMNSLLVQKNVNLASYTSWKVGGEAEFFSEPKTVENLQEVVNWALSEELAITVLSGGTNVLVSDGGLSGLVVSTSKLQGIEEVSHEGDEFRLSVLAGTSKFEVMRKFLKNDLSPALFLAGLPGDIGGGVAMNAGVREKVAPREFVEIVDWVDVLQWNEDSSFIHRYQNSDLQWGYRHCRGWQPGVIVRVGLCWSEPSHAEVRQWVKEANQRRLSKQPLDKPSCGSVFRNPEGFSSGQLIEECGLKGKTIGGAQVSEKHANFIINTGDASSQDIFDLIGFVQREVKDQKNIELQTEVVFLGFNGR